MHVCSHFIVKGISFYILTGTNALSIARMYLLGTLFDYNVTFYTVLYIELLYFLILLYSENFLNKHLFD